MFKVKLLFCVHKISTILQVMGIRLFTKYHQLGCILLLLLILHILFGLFIF